MASLPSAQPLLGDLSLIVPTYKEVENIPRLLARLENVRPLFAQFEVLIVDDNSQDGTEPYMAQSPFSWARLITRTRNRGLSPAVVDGIRQARFDQICVMDADLSHPPETIASMIQTLQSGKTEFVIGSRYCEGGRIDLEWSLFRHLNSKLATWLARPFTRAKDPLSGFFCFRKELVDRARDLNPIGYKIGLELLVKSRARHVEEVPIVFADRTHGESKLSMKEQINYLRHLKRLFDYKFGNLSFFIQFGLSGVMGLITNLSLLQLFLWLGVPIRLSVGLAIGLSMIVTFLGNRWITFNHGSRSAWPAQLAAFVSASALGALLNWYTTLKVIESLSFPPIHAALVGSMAGMVSNFTLSRYVIFKKNLQTKSKS